MTNPLFSVIIPLFNHEQFLGEAIRSVLRQSETDLELIIIDDGSTDNSAQVVESFKDPRIHYQYQENLGASFALNRGLAMARGDFVAILNSDDTFHLDRLRYALAAFESQPSLGAFFSAYHFIDESSATIRESTDILKSIRLPLSSVAASTEAFSKESDEWILTLLSGNVLHTTSNLVIRTSVIEQIGLFHSWRYVHDYDFFLRLCASNRVYFDERPLLNYRFHGSNSLAENAAHSVYETVLVIANFLADWHPKTNSLENGTFYKFFRHFFQDLRLYGGERFLLALILTELVFREKGRITEGSVIRMLRNDSVFQLVAPDLGVSVAYNQLNEHLGWQKTETDRWWRKSQEFKSELNWQKEQTDHWWREAQNLNERLSEVNDALIKANRFLGIPNVKQSCKRKLISIFKKEISK